MECPACGTRQEAPAARFCPACGLEVPSAPDPFIGKVLGGRFRVQSLLAEGGMGRVYVAEQRMGTTLRRVAIKMLLSEYSKAEHQVTRFLRECSMVTELEHPNTIKFYDYGKTDEGDLFIAMEFVSGESLAALVKRLGRLPPERVDVIMSQICGSLQEAHDKGIIHRDLKPENILLTAPAGEDDFVKVLDFGIAKRLDGDPKLTPFGLVLGSPAYMSPEQFTHGEIDGRSDIYAISVVCFEALTGYLPFSAKEIMEWPILHRHSEPLTFEATGVDVPLNMRRAILRGLGKKPDDRQATMREFFTELTIGTPRRSTFTSTRPPADEAATLLKVPTTPPPGAAGSLRPADAGSAGSVRPQISGPSTSPPRPGESAPPRALRTTPMAAHVSIPPAGRVPAFGVDAIRDELSGVPPTVRDPVPVTMREPRRRGVILILGMLLALAIGGTVAAAWFLLEGEESAPPPVRARPAGATSARKAPAKPAAR
jgi:eukaryotic-like serine/threonine-protein kinase